MELMSKTIDKKKKEVVELSPDMELELEDYHLGYREFFALSRKLEAHHAVFYQLWEIGKPVFTNSIETAAVRFNKEGHCIEFIFNLKFWKSLTDDQRVFIISHECLHVILRHGIRFIDADGEAERRASNVAMDVVVNELLLEQFGFERKHVDPQSKYCFMESIFKDEKTGKVRTDIDRKQNYEYYFNGLPEASKITKYVLVDIHDLMNGDEAGEAIGKLNGTLSPEDKESLRKTIEKHFEKNKQDKEKESKERGESAGGSWRFMDLSAVKPKRKWETVIKKWAEKYIKNDFDYFEHWARANRRIIELPEDVILPSEMEIQDAAEEGRITVYFFLDTSGSCSHLAERFWKASKSLPKGRFDKKLFCFDTKVYEVDEKKGELFGFGGTSFDIIENAIQEDIAKQPEGKKKYPSAVFVITDGYGNEVKPAKPKNWYWFLTEHSSDSCFPKECKKFNLKDYE
jgi:predicted metal-dependent peptidase